MNNKLYAPIFFGILSPNDFLMWLTNIKLKTVYILIISYDKKFDYLSSEQHIQII